MRVWSQLELTFGEGIVLRVCNDEHRFASVLPRRIAAIDDCVEEDRLRYGGKLDGRGQEGIPRQLCQTITQFQRRRHCCLAMCNLGKF